MIFFFSLGYFIRIIISHIYKSFNNKSFNKYNKKQNGTNFKNKNHIMFI